MNNDLYIQSFCLEEGKRRKGKVSRPESGEGIGPNGQEASLPTISHTKKSTQEGTQSERSSSLLWRRPNKEKLFYWDTAVAASGK